MSLEMLTPDKVQIKDQVNAWSEAIDIASQPLLQQEYFDERYIQAMIDSVHNLGPYIVIAPEIAIAHARPDESVNKVGLSLLKLENHINFSAEGHYASLIFVLSAVDNTKHLEILKQLAQALGDQQIVERLLQTTDKNKLISILKGE